MSRSPSLLVRQDAQSYQVSSMQVHAAHMRFIVTESRRSSSRTSPRGKVAANHARHAHTTVGWVSIQCEFVMHPLPD